jgi:hypothetical protein
VRRHIAYWRRSSQQGQDRAYPWSPDGHFTCGGGRGHPVWTALLLSFQKQCARARARRSIAAGPDSQCVLRDNPVHVSRPASHAWPQYFRPIQSTTHRSSVSAICSTQCFKWRCLLMNQKIHLPNGITTVTRYDTALGRKLALVGRQQPATGQWGRQMSQTSAVFVWRDVTRSGTPNARQG